MKRVEEFIKSGRRFFFNFLTGACAIGLINLLGASLAFGSYSVGASAVSPTSVAPGKAIHLTSSVTSTSNASKMIVQFVIYGPHGARIDSKSFTGQSFTKSTRTLKYVWDYTLPSNAVVGSYSVGAGVFDTSWNNVMWKNSVATFTVSGVAPSPSPTPTVTPAPTATPSPSPSPGVPPTGEVNFNIDVQANRQAISPYIYGTNYETSMMTGIGAFRMGGNRWTTYNWENNATNGGTDNGNSSGNRVCDLVGCGSNSEKPGEAVRLGVLLAYKYGATPIVTIPIVNYVAADKNGTITSTASPMNARFRQNMSRKPSSSSAPNASLGDNFVYQDEAIRYFQSVFIADLTAGRKIFYMLDNEPGIWNSTHPLIHPDRATYAELVSKNIEFASMIKDYAPNSMVFGPVAYGFNDMMSLQDAPDRGTQVWFDVYLSKMAAAEKTYGKRLIDVLDMHWGSEARGDGYRVLDETAPQTPGLIQARLQAPRSLWDPTYVEDSWITNDYNGKKPIMLIPSLKSRINANYPGTKISFSEYNHGGAQDISGGIAEADVLGIFGREGVFAATHWDREDSPYIYGAMRMYVNYDGSGARVGDVSVKAQTTDVAASSVYAMQPTADSNVLHVVALNKKSVSVPANIYINNAGGFSKVTFYQISSSSSTPKNVGSQTLTGSYLKYSMPPMTVTTLVFTK